MFAFLCKWVLFVESFLAGAFCASQWSRGISILVLGVSMGVIKPFIINYPHDHHHVSLLLLREASWVTACRRLSVLLWLHCFSYSPLNKTETYSHACVSPAAGVLTGDCLSAGLKPFRDADRLMRVTLWSLMRRECCVNEVTKDGRFDGKESHKRECALMLNHTMTHHVLNSQH